MAVRLLFDLTAAGTGWFDETADPAGWFDPDLATVADANPAASAPGWDTQPVLVTRAPAIARAVVAAIVVAGIDAAYVPPAVAQAAPGWEAQPPAVARRAVVVEPQESLSFGGRRVAAGFESQPSTVRPRSRRVGAQESAPFPSTLKPLGFEAQPLLVSAHQRTLPAGESGPLDVAVTAVAGYEFLTEQAVPVLRRPFVAVVSEGWPLDVTVVPVTVSYEFLAEQPSSATRRSRVSTQESLPFAAPTTGFLTEQSARVKTRPGLSVAQEPTALAVAPQQAGFDGTPPTIRRRGFTATISDGWPVDSIVVEVVAVSYEFLTDRPPLVARQLRPLLIGDSGERPPLPAVEEPPVTPPPPASGGGMPSRHGRWVRVDDGSAVHLQANDCTAVVRLDRPALGVAHLDVAIRVVLDRPAVGLVSHLSAQDVDILAAGGRPALGRDDLPEVMRLLKMTDKVAKPAPASDVSRIWSMIDAFRGKKS